MLHKSAVESNTFSVLKDLMQMAELENFFLVGGTCLALRYGHRTSVDIDLFSTADFEIDALTNALEKKIKGFSYRTKNNIGVFGYINNLKVDLVKNHYFKQIDTPVTVETIRMFGDKDLMAMKVFAILKRAHKKDFYDVSELLNHYTVKNFIEAYTLKYPAHQLLISIPQALVYFDDAEESEDPVSLKNQTWNEVKSIIRKKVSEYLQ